MTTDWRAVRLLARRCAPSWRTPSSHVTRCRRSCTRRERRRASCRGRWRAARGAARVWGGGWRRARARRTRPQP
eukprot:2003801-Prymnesium_polylepis.1